MRVETREEAARHDLWGKEQFLLDLESQGGILKVCRMYAGYAERPTWQAYYQDVLRWRRADRDFDEKVKAVVERENGHAFETVGRPESDGGDKSWQDVYVQLLEEYSGDENRARIDSGAPYTLSYIKELCSPTSSSYDEAFAKRCSESWGRIGSAFQGILFGTRHDIGEKLTVDTDDDETLERTFTKAKILETKARIATKAMEKSDPARWGQQANLNISGRVDHVHSQERYLTKGQIVASLIEDRQRFMQKKQELLAANNPPLEKEEILDAEIVREDSAADDASVP